MSEIQKAKKPDLVAKAALLFGSGTLTSRIFGLIRDTLVFALLPRDMRDAWLAAFRLPNFFRRLLGEGGLSVSFIPVFVDLTSQGEQAERKHLIDGVFTLLMSLSTLICLIYLIFMDQIIPFWLSGPGFADVPGKLEMTILMGRLMAFFLFFISLFAYFMALLNGVKKFTLSGYAPLFLNLSIIVNLWIFKDSQYLVKASALSVVIGGALQAFILIPAVAKNSLIPRLSFRWNHPQVQRVLKKFLPTVFGVGVLQVLTIVNTYFASQLAPGSLSHIFLADRLLELPLSLIAVSIGTTLLPTLSQYWSKENKSLFLECLQKHLHLFYFLAIPAAFGLWFLGTDIIDIIFRRGQFTANDVPVVAAILKIYCFSLLFAGSLKILNQAFYATGDTLTPALISMTGLVIHLLVAPILMERLGIQGLILSTVSITFFNLFCCLFLLQRRVGFLAWVPLIKHGISCFIAGGVMGVYLYGLSQMNWRQGRFILDFPILLVLIGIAAALFFTTAGLLKIKEMQQLKAKLRRR